MTHNELSQLVERLHDAAHIYQEIGGDISAVADQIKVIIGELPTGYIRGWLDSWATWYDQQDERDAFRALANFSNGIYAATLELEND